MPDDGATQEKKKGVAFNIDLSADVLAEIGKIKTGAKSVRGTEKYDHFVVTTLERDESGKLKPDAIIHADSMYGKTPRELHVMLPYDSEMANFAVYRGLYFGKRPQCIGNGVSAQKRGEAEWTIPSGGMKAKECLGVDCPFATGEYVEMYKARNIEVPKSEPKCKLHGILHCILYRANARFGGVYVYRTTSYYTIKAIQSQIKQIMKFTGGKIRYIPLVLRFQFDVKGGNRIPFVTLEFSETEVVEPTFVKLAKAAAQIDKYLQGAEDDIKRLTEGRLKQLEAGGAVSEFDDEEVAEFHPEVEEGARTGEFRLETALREREAQLTELGMTLPMAMLRFGNYKSEVVLDSAIADHIAKLAPQPCVDAPVSASEDISPLNQQAPVVSPGYPPFDEFTPTGIDESRVVTRDAAGDASPTLPDYDDDLGAPAFTSLTPPLPEECEQQDFLAMRGGRRREVSEPTMETTKAGAGKVTMPPAHSAAEALDAVAKVKEQIKPKKALPREEDLGF